MWFKASLIAENTVTDGTLLIYSITLVAAIATIILLLKGD